MEKKRDAREVRDINIARLKKDYEKTNNTVCPPEKVKQFEKYVKEQLLPRVYEK